MLVCSFWYLFYSLLFFSWIIVLMCSFYNWSTSSSPQLGNCVATVFTYLFIFVPFTAKFLLSTCRFYSFLSFSWIILLYAYSIALLVLICVLFIEYFASCALILVLVLVTFVPFMDYFVHVFILEQKYFIESTFTHGRSLCSRRIRPRSRARRRSATSLGHTVHYGRRSPPLHKSF